MKEHKTNIDAYFLNFVANTVQGHFIEKDKAVDLEYIVEDMEASPEEIEIVKDFALEAYYGLEKEYNAEREFQEAIKDSKTHAKIVTYGIIPAGGFLLGSVMTQNLLGGFATYLVARSIAINKETSSRSISAMLSGVKGRKEGEIYNRWAGIGKTLYRLDQLSQEAPVAVLESNYDNQYGSSRPDSGSTANIDTPPNSSKISKDL